LTFILVLLLLDFDIERRRRVLGFEAGHNRHSAIQAETKRKISHEAGTFFIRALAPIKIEAERAVFTSLSAST
jgi:hypothetical protein